MSDALSALYRNPAPAWVLAALTGRSLRVMKLRETFGVTIVAIRRDSGEFLVNPPADTVLLLNDRLQVLGRSDEIDAFEAQVAAQDPTPSGKQPRFGTGC